MKIENYKRGYTIIETMISISIFMVVIAVGMGALLNANLLHEKSRDMRSIMDSLNFVMEDMSSSLRTGYNYRCYDGSGDITSSGISEPDSCENGWGIAFEYQSGDPDAVGDQWAYFIGNDGKIYKSTDGATSFIPVTPDEVVIDPSSGFVVTGAEVGDNLQPFVTIRLIGEIKYRDTFVSPFSLQTSVSQRNVDVQ